MNVWSIWKRETDKNFPEWQINVQCQRTLGKLRNQAAGGKGNYILKAVFTNKKTKAAEAVEIVFK